MTLLVTEYNEMYYKKTPSDGWLLLLLAVEYESPYNLKWIMCIITISNKQYE